MKRQCDLDQALELIASILPSALPLSYDIKQKVLNLLKELKTYGEVTAAYIRWPIYYEVAAKDYLMWAISEAERLRLERIARDNEEWQRRHDEFKERWHKKNL